MFCATCNAWQQYCVFRWPTNIRVTARVYAQCSLYDARQYAVCHPYRMWNCVDTVCLPSTEKTIITLNDHEKATKSRENYFILLFSCNGQARKGEWGQRTKMWESHAYKMFIWIKIKEKSEKCRARRRQHTRRTKREDKKQHKKKTFTIYFHCSVCVFSFFLLFQFVLRVCARFALCRFANILTFLWNVNILIVPYCETHIRSDGNLISQDLRFLVASLFRSMVISITHVLEKRFYL